MNEKFEYNGLWWLPETLQNQVSGRLRFSPGKGAVLEVLGALDESRSWDRDFNPSLILGISDTGKRITLYDCQWTQASFSSLGIPKQTFSASIVFVGAHFEAPDNVKFKKVSVHYANLDEWVAKPGFNIDHSEPGTRKLTVTYVQPEPAKIDINGCKMTVGSFGPSTRHSRFKEVSISQKAWVSISSEEEKPLDWFLDVLYHVRNFLSLGMSEPTYPLAVQGVTEASKQDSDGGSDLYLPVGVFYQVPFLPAEIKTIHPHDMLFTLLAIQDGFQLYFSNWIGKADLLKPVYDLYFSTLYNPEIYVESEFLSLAQAIETYHRRKFGGKYQSDEEYREGLYLALVGAIPEDTDKDFKLSLIQGRLKFANEFSLRKRLKEITERLSSRLGIGFIASNESRQRFVNNVYHTRNFLTHYTHELQERSAEGKELVELTMKLKALLTICLLEELGLTFTVIGEIINRSRKLKFMLGSEAS